MREWEAQYEGHLPLRALQRSLRLSDEELSMLMTIGLPEEDARFGALFEILNGAQGLRRPTVGLFATWWSREMDVSSTVHRLRSAGLVSVANAGSPRAEWQLAVPPLLWDAIRGTFAPRAAPWLELSPREELRPLERLVLDEDLAARLIVIATALEDGAPLALIVRGPHSNGRRTVLKALARAAGRAALEISGLGGADDARWSDVGPLATLLHAMPLLVMQPDPGTTASIPELTGHAGPVGVALGRMGGVAGKPVAQPVTIELGMPEGRERERHWREAFEGARVEDMDAILANFRLTRGNIRRVASLAVRQAMLAGHEAVATGDVQEAARSLNREALDTLATRVGTGGEWSQVATAESTAAELRGLEARCRHREALGRMAGLAKAMPNAGVRALFKGASGTGKTLAARVLAQALGMDLYRVDLSTVVNKYIGETEKNLERVFCRAEELDVILFFDEGDALFTQRTDVSSANDRYANLETNYLLQRIESYTGIVLVASNAADERIDGAFMRRMDAVIEFMAPQARERWNIWNLHLPPGHGIDPARLWELADRCALTGGQIRNAAMHAALLALEARQPVGVQDLAAAVRREYRKSGAVCPLPAG